MRLTRSLQFGTGEQTDPFATTNRLLAKGFIKIPLAEDIQVPQELINEWFSIWQKDFANAEFAFKSKQPDYYASVSDEIRNNIITGTYMLTTPSVDSFIYRGAWNFVLQRRIEDYRMKQQAGLLNSMVMTGDTLMSAARREAVALNRTKYQEILDTKGHLLSSDEKKKLEKFFLYQFDTPSTAQEIAEVQAILDRIYKVEPVSNQYTTMPVKNTLPLFPGLTDTTDWETQGAVQKNEVLIKDAALVSPLETAFLQAGKDIQEDVKYMTTGSSTSTGEEAGGKNMLLWIGLGILALKLIRR